jgi:hypothetical protein
MAKGAIFSVETAAIAIGVLLDLIALQGQPRTTGGGRRCARNSLFHAEMTAFLGTPSVGQLQTRELTGIPAKGL